jgi:hypothetical protein
MTIGRNWKPGVPRRWLYLLSGLIWCGVGLMLMRWTWFWSMAAGWWQVWPYDAAGLILGVATATFFAWMAGRNRDRITALPTNPCLFAFQSWWSYPLVIVMISLGLVLKASPLPRTWLASIYLAIGGGLFLAGTRYFAWLLQKDCPDKAGWV